MALVDGAACRSLRAGFGTEFPWVVHVTAVSISYEDYVSFWVGASHVHALGELSATGAWNNGSHDMHHLARKRLTLSKTGLRPRPVCRSLP